MWIASLLKYLLFGYGILKLIRWFLQRTWGSVDKSNEISARNKVVLITGANAGIGKCTALEFARRDAIVILACRDLNRADGAVKWIRARTSLGQLICMKLDLASLKSVRSFCKEFQSKYDRLDILVNNAGVLLPPEEERRTTDGFEIHMGVNHLGHFLLTNLLLDSLKKASPSRIVILSSMAHKWSTLDMTDIMSDKQHFTETSRKYRPNHLYCRSKIANALFNKELSKKLKGSGVRTYALCPGIVATDIFQHDTVKGPVGSLVKMLIGPILLQFMKSPEEGATTTMHCALSKNLMSESGEMYQNCGYWHPKDRAVLKDADAKCLWEQSAKLVGLN